MDNYGYEKHFLIRDIRAGSHQLGLNGFQMIGPLKVMQFCFGKNIKYKNNKILYRQYLKLTAH